MVLDYLAGGHDRRMSFRDYVAKPENSATTDQSAYRLHPDPCSAHRRMRWTAAECQPNVRYW